MKIDTSNIHSRYLKNKNGFKVVPSDHFPIFAWFNIKYRSNLRSMRRRDTLYNFSDKNGILKFKKFTSKDSLSSIFGSGHILEEARLWLKSVKNMLHQAFPVVRVKNKSV